MSFDLVFDYSNLKKQVNERIIRKKSISDDLQTQISKFESISGFQHVVSDHIQSLANQKVYYDSELAYANEVLVEIIAVEALPTQDKNDLYKFFILSGDDTPTFMRRILFNHVGILSNEDVRLLLTDEPIDQGKKELLSKCICSCYRIDMKVRLV